MYGFYRGRLDGWWGPETLAALKEALDLEEIDHDQALGELREGYLAINAEYVFGHVFDRLDAAHLTMEEYEDSQA